jgi:hypothetical protein
MSSNDFALFTANTNRNPSPVRMYWSLIALSNESNLIKIKLNYNLKVVNIKKNNNYEFYR